MNETLTNLLMIVVTVAVPVVSGLLVKGVGKVTDILVEKSQNETFDMFLTEIGDAVADAVAMTSQTYVDSLKAAGTFDEAAQKAAFEKAFAACVGSLGQSAKDFIQNNFGDMTAYLTTRIEAEVKRQKLIA